MHKDHLVRDVKVGDFQVRTFDHSESPLLGVGPERKKFIDFEPFVNTDLFNELHLEVQRGLPRCENMKLPKVEGEIPPHLRGQYDNRSYEGKALINASDQDLENMRGMNRQQRRRYALMFLEAVQPWWFNVYLRDAVFEEKTRRNPVAAEWLPDARFFPKLIPFIESLPFNSIGRVLFFCTESGKGVPPHRDYPPVRHKDHNINFFFDGPRPSYVYDCTLDEKFYLPTTRAYFFNNRDYHGVDPEKRFRYTLRVDGTFNNEILQELGLENGWVC